MSKIGLTSFCISLLICFLILGGVPPSKPIVIIEERKEIKVSIGQRIEVRCRASGYPSPHVEWSRQDQRPLSPTVN